MHAEPFYAGFRFNDVPSNAFLLGTAAVNAETLKLTTRPSGLPPYPAKAGSFVVDDLAAGRAIGGFTVTFNALISGGPGEGMSFCWGPGLPLIGTAFGEEGPASFQGVVVSFDTTDNDGDGTADAVAIDLRWQGALVVSQTVNATVLRQNTFVPVIITLSNRVLSVQWNGNYYINRPRTFADLFYSPTQLPNFAPVAGARFGWGARNRTSSTPQDNHWIDDIAITFPPPVVSLSSPSAGSNAATLRGIVASPGSEATWFFEYGETAAYGLQTPVQSLSGSNVSAPLSGLTPGTTCHYRLVASNAGGTSQTGDAIFTPIFDEVAAALPGTFCPPAWADYDNDGDMDLALAARSDAGAPRVQVRRNDGAGVFTDIQAGLPVVESGSLAWGDYDNDGDVDLALTGREGPTALAQIWRNDGTGPFVNIHAALPGVEGGSVAWGDFDNDGDLDLALCGFAAAANGITRICRNDGGGVFIDIQAGLPGADHVAWGDYDNDSDLDLALAGNSSSNAGTTLWRNDGSGIFTAARYLPAAARLVWGDYDNDGDLDLALTSPSVNSTTSILRNDGGGVFTDILAGVPAGNDPAWGDFDNDGDLDLVVAFNYGTRIGRNNGNGSFTTLYPAVQGSHSVAWGDFDNDGDLDLVAGSGSGPMPLLSNGLLAPNTPPPAPTSLAGGDSGTQMTFAWMAQADDHTPAAALTYSLRVGSAPGMSDVLAAAANLNTGVSRLPQMGAQQTGTTARLTLPPGRYYWSVQAVDGAFAGGAWAPEQTYVHTNPPSAVTQGVTAITWFGAAFSGSANPGGGNTMGFFEYGLTTTYGSTTPDTALGSGITNVPHSATVTGMAADSIYHFRARARNAFGEGVGADVSFRTLAFTAGPNLLTASLAPDASVVLPVTLTNHTAAALAVAINFQAPAPGWAVVPASRNVPANGNTTVNVFFDATGLPAGSQQTATLHFDAGGGRVPIDVPVTLNVTAPAFDREEFLPGEGGVRLTWNWPGGQTFPVQVSDNLVDWNTLGTTVGTGPGVFAITDPQAAGKTHRFYRPVLSP